MIVDITNFCSLSRAADFQEWLKAVSPNSYHDLMEHLKLGKSCGSNKNKMRIIYDELKKASLNDALIAFLKMTHPNMLIADKDDVAKPDGIPPPKVSSEDANIHKVFPIYKPGLLMLPQQAIFIGATYETVINQIVGFLRNKISTDYIILKSNLYWHGYAEYFDRKFIGEAEKVDRSKRPIAQYKLKYGIK